MMQNPMGKQVDFTRYLKLAWKWKWLILTPTAVFPLVAGFYAMGLQDSFKSSTLILVTPQKVPAKFVSSTVTTGISERLNTISQQIFSRTRLEQIIQEFNLFERQRKSRTPEEIIEMMRGKIKLNVNRKNAFQLSYVDANPRLAMLVTNKLASLFIEENLKVREQQAIGTSQFLQDEIDRYREQVRERERTIHEYKQRHILEMPEQLASNQSKLTQLQNQLQINTQNINAAEDRRVRLQQQLAEIERRATEKAEASAAPGPGLSISEQLSALFQEETGGGPGATVDTSALRALEEQIAKREALVEQMLLTYTERHPDVARIKAEIARLEEKATEERAWVEAEEARLAAEQVEAAAAAAAAEEQALPPLEAEPAEETGPQYPPIYFSVQQDLLRAEADVVRLTAHNEEVQRSIELFQRRIAATPQRKLELGAISEDYDNIRRVLEGLINKKLQADLSENLERKQKGEQFKILDPANLPEKPFSPNRSRIVSAGLAAGLAFGLGFVFLLDLLDFSVRNRDELAETVEAPVLIVIPKIRTSADLRRQWLWRLGVSLGAAACLLIAVGVVHLRIKPIPTAIQDLYQQVRTTHWKTIR